AARRLSGADDTRVIEPANPRRVPIASESATALTCVAAPRRLSLSARRASGCPSRAAGAFPLTWATSPRAPRLADRGGLAMLRRRLIAALVAFAIDGMAAIAAADIVCPDSSYCTVAFTNPAKDRITISPAGTGDTFAGTGITIRVFLKNCQGAPLVGVPLQEIVLFNSGLCICPGGNIADAATDMNGMTGFSGTLRGGGCVESLQVFADGVRLCSLAV